MAFAAALAAAFLACVIFALGFGGYLGQYDLRMIDFNSWRDKEMRILLLCLNAFETMEFSPFVDVFGWAHDDFNCDIVIDICGFNRTIVSTFGVSITADILIDDVDVDQYDALAIPGGFEEYGFYKEAYHEKTLNLIRSFHSQHKPIASVCVAAFSLAKSGILKDRKATT